MEEKAFGRYRLRGLLGRGGMGQVFRAYDTATDRVVALKVLPPELAQDAMFQQRFRREAHTVARFSAPHVVPIHNYGEIDGRLYVDMQLIDGRDLGTVLAEGGAMDPARAVRIIEQAADALDAAHEMGLVHRDVKPSNILLARRDFVYLIDFGIARQLDATRLTSTGAAIGTLAYMAPERFDTGTAEPSSDIYALGCVLHECLTGQQPFPGTTAQQQIAGHLTKPPPRPSVIEAGVPPAFDEVIARGMAKRPGERFQTTIELADAARAALAGRPSHAPPPPQEAPTQVAPTQPGPVRDAPPPAPLVDTGSAPTESLQPARVAGRRRGTSSSNRPAGLLMVAAALMAAGVSAYSLSGSWDDPWIRRLSYRTSFSGYEYVYNNYYGGYVVSISALVACLVFSAAFVLFGRRLLAQRGQLAAIIPWLVSAAFVLFGIEFVLGAFPLEFLWRLALIMFLLLIVLGVFATWVTKEWYNLLASAAGLIGAAGTIDGGEGVGGPYELYFLWIPVILVFGIFLYRSTAKNDH